MGGGAEIVSDVSRSAMFAEGEQLSGVVATELLGRLHASISGDVGRELTDPSSSSSSMTELSGDDEDKFRPCDPVISPDPDVGIDSDAEENSLLSAGAYESRPDTRVFGTRFSSPSSYSIGLGTLRDG